MATLLRALRTMGYKLGFAALAFLNTTVITRYLSVSDKGVYTALTIALLFLSTYVGGFGTFFNYGLNRLKHDRAAVVGVLARLFLIALTVNLILFAAALALTPVIGDSPYAAFVLGSIPFVVFYGYASRLIQALNEIDWLNRLNMIQPGLLFAFALAIDLLDHLRVDAVTARLLPLTLAAWLLSNVLAAAAVYIAARRLAGVPFRPRRDAAIAKALWHYGHNVSLQNVLTQFNLRGDYYCVLFLLTTTAAGHYSIAIVGSEVLWNVSNSVSLMVYTRVAHHERAGSIALTERTFRLNFWLMVACGLFLAGVFSPLIPVVFTNRYTASVPAFQLLVIGATAYGAVGVLTQFFTDQLGKVKYPMYMQGASFALNILLCLILIPHWGIEGAALGSSAGYTLCLTASIFYYRRNTGRPFRNLFWFTPDDRALLHSLLTRGRGGLNESRE